MIFTNISQKILKQDLIIKNYELDRPLPKEKFKTLLV